MQFCNITATDKALSVFNESINGSAGSIPVNKKEKVPQINNLYYVIIIYIMTYYIYDRNIL